MSNRGNNNAWWQSLPAMLLGVLCVLPYGMIRAQSEVPISQFPLFIGGGIDARPLTMLVMGRDHTLYYEAYNDASDLNGDNVLDVGYKPSQVDYFGYFDSKICYTYSSGRFVPDSKTVDKKCPGKWSGDFLNWVTTSRIDALRKVLYGGHRVVDTATETVLERSYIPQDAHSWGKEYKSVKDNGYDIGDYTPLSLPSNGTRHLFANTTLLKSGNKEPLMRILQNSKYRIWEWVAIERPVAGDLCLHGGTGPTCTTSGGTTWEVVPGSVLALTQTTYKKTGSSPGNESAFNTLVTLNAVPSNLCGSQTVSTINGSGNPFSGVNGCTNNNYLTIFEGTITIPEAGTYTFSVDGDDAVDLHINGVKVADWYNAHAACNCTTHQGTVTLSQGVHSIRFRHEEVSGGDSYSLKWEQTVPASVRQDYVVRTQVCKSSDLLDANCMAYTDSATGTVTYKPDGLLQKYGNDDKMLFGLMSGSFTHPYNISGGVLRKNIASFKDEIDLKTGIFKADVTGIVRTIDRFRIVDFNMTTNYEYAGGWLTTAAMPGASKKFPDWGNPLAEMMYETLRYFSGEKTPTTSFMPGLTANMERVTLRDYNISSTMDLPAPQWIDPYKDAGALYCSPAAQLLISDVNPSYDTDSIPGSAWPGFGGSIGTLNATSEANAIWGAEHGGSSSHFIGQVGSDYDGAPTAKTVTGLGNIRGLSPSEPTKQGGYYSAGIARYGFRNDLRSDLGDDKGHIQNINTFAVALASPLPKIVIPLDGKLVTIVPYAKSVGGMSISATKGDFQPTDTIVDFFIEEFANTDPKGSDANLEINGGRPSIKFRINYEDVEQGADHDMDAIVLYDLKVNADKTLTVSLDSSYAAGGIIQHMGYVISGTTADGVYLDVRDKDTASGSDPQYFLDTPPGLSPGACNVSSPPAACANALPLQAARTFTASSSATIATVLENPLWYAAKYGSTGSEGLAKGAPSPNYFLVTNAGNLQKQLEEAFTRIIELAKSTSASVAASSTRAKSDTRIFQAKFDSADWSGELKALDLFISNAEEEGPKEWLGPAAIPDPDDRAIYTWNPETVSGIPFSWDDEAINETQRLLLSNNELILDWLRGDQGLETDATSATGFRKRTKLLGDIVNSDPLYVGKPLDLGYGKLPEGTAGQNTYSVKDGFLDYHSKPEPRTPMIYVGANDGMLHAFNALTGVEEFAYVPNAVFPNLASLASKSYQHRYFVDGSPAVSDAYVSGAWRSILIGTLGAGGRAVFALDVTNPTAFDVDDILWEMTDGDLGYMAGQMTSSPVIGRLQNGEWAAVFGNGYDSGTGAWIYIVKLADGSLIKKIQVSSDVTNGLSAVALIRDSEMTIAGAYAGDLKGNIWKFDLSSNDSDNWSIAYGGPLFQATNDVGDSQPITGPLDVGVHPSGGYLVFFGTGQYMRSTDPISDAVQTAYGIWDNSILKKDAGNPTQTIWDGGGRILTGRLSLLEQTILYEGKLSALNEDDERIIAPEDDVYAWRVISKKAMTWGSRSSPIKRGWYLDLVSPVNDEEGERVVTRPQILSGTGLVMFTSLVPVETDDPCETGGGNSWIFAVDMFSGGRSEGATFDVNNDDLFNDEDLIRVTIDGELIDVPLSGFGLDQIIDSPRALADGTDYTLVTAGSDGNDAEESPGVDGGLIGRQGWRQLR